MTTEGWFGEKIEAVLDFLFGFIFEKLPIISIVAAVLFLIWKLLDPTIIVD